MIGNIFLTATIPDPITDAACTPIPPLPAPTTNLDCSAAYQSYTPAT